MFESFKSGLKKIFSKGGADSIKLSELEESLITMLIESDVDLDTAEDIYGMLSQKLGSRGKISTDELRDHLREALQDILAPLQEKSDILNPGKKPYIILFLGVNGGGKTTTVAKIAHYLSERGKKCIISASDTFRAGAIEQIENLAGQVRVEVMKQPQGADPAAVAFDAINRATARGYDYVLIDSAGRMQTNRNLLEEMKKIKRITKPDLTILVLDSLTGQDAINQATTFFSEVSYDSVIVTKLDTDARGGAIISIASRIKKPIIFIGTGQKMDDLMPFSVSWYMEKIFGTEKARNST
ncbi:MAG: signal recognition particle-docking protein FtsY [Candidatus Thermoplasmatota archaeon]|nr:signal recognition particle-docking protein FtsY [Candidatus Thermoplasmatota archaeon]